MTELPLIALSPLPAFLQFLVCLAKTAKSGNQDSVLCRVGLSQDRCLAKISFSWLGFGNVVGGCGFAGASPLMGGEPTAKLWNHIPFPSLI